jgi:uncharacterized protein (TIGR00251 family)
MSAADGTTLQVRVVPRARRTGLGGWSVAGGLDDALVVRLAAVPVDGAANQALIEFLARLLGVPRRSVTIVSGDRSRNKRVRVEGLSREQLIARISAGLDGPSGR